ncbi:MAG TPA: hypothetical protein VNO33_12435 [Kofleriaceae bacterium]|nr:hypothetical protein [Kofleriaceae bacterium]
MAPVHSRLVLVVLAAALAVLPASADAQKKKKKSKVKPACGLKVLPFAEGSEWTYQYFVPEGVQLPPGVRIQDPPTMTVKVTKIAKSGGKTIISLEESYRKVVVKTDLECDKKGLTVPPESFFFVGQPGGGLLMKLGKIERKAETNVFAGGGLKGEAFEELKTTATREPSPGSGAAMTPAKMEIERKMTVGPGKETVESGITSHKAQRLTIQMTGRATLETTPDKPFNMPTLDAAMFFEPDVGVVQVRNSLGQGWKLSEHKTGAEE